MAQAKNRNAALLTLLFAGAFVSAFNENIVNVAILDVTEAFSVTYNDAQWLVTGYMIVTTIVTTTMAFLYRRFSVKRLFLVSCAILAGGSALCLFAPTFPTLLVCRLAQAIGSGVLIPVMMNTVLVVAPHERIGSYLSIGGACITLGPAFGPVVSGIMATALGWRAIFIPTLVATVAMGLAAIKIIGIAGAGKPGKLDAASVALSAVGLTLFVYGLNALTGTTAVALLALALGIGALVLFARRQFALEDPMMNLRPLRQARFSLACILVIVAMMTTFSMSVLLPLYFEGAFGMTALAAGALILPPIAVNAVTSIIGGRVMDRFGSWPLLPLGFLIIAAGQVGTALFGGMSDLIAVVACSVVVYAGVGLVLSPSQTAGLKSLSAQDHPHGVAIISTIVMIAASIGPSLFVGILSSSAELAIASGASSLAAEAQGFASAVQVAAVIGLAGFAVAAFYAAHALKRRRAALRRSADGDGAQGACEAQIAPNVASKATLEGAFEGAFEGAVKPAPALSGQSPSSNSSKM